MARALAEVDARTIKQLAQSKWQSSGLSDGHARRLGFRAISAAEVKRLGARFHEAGALHIPYFDLDGKQTKFFRVRYLEKLPGAAGIAKKPQRYDQLPVLQEVYYPPIHDWRKIAENPKVAVAVTEGELKAACACVNKIPMMGLGGVYSFMSGKRGVDLLPSLKEFDWRERVVYVVWDNDLLENPDVMAAQLRFSQRLLAEGALISYISIPPGPDKGVDDFIVKHGVKAFAALFDKAEPYPEASALWEINSEVAYIKKINAVVERSSSLLMYPDPFVRHLYGNRFYMQSIEKGSGKNKHVVLEKAPLAKRWMEWEHRSELWDVVYEPGEGRIINDCWNLWNDWGVKPKKGDVRPWTWLLDFLFPNDKKARRYFEQWCAYPIQHPGAKMFAAVLLWSRLKRIGKSMVGIALQKIYGENGIIVQGRELQTGFNSWAANKQFVVGEEFTVNHRRDADYMKHIITSPMFRINEKHKPEYDIENHLNMLLLSNHPDAVQLEDGDKRYLIHAIHHGPAERAKYEWCHKWLHGDGPAYLMDHLLRLDLRGFNPRESPPDTESKLMMVQSGKDRIGHWIMKLQEDPVHALRALGASVAEGCDLFTSEQLFHACDPNGRGGPRDDYASLGRALQAAGFRQVNGGGPVGTATGVHRLYAIRNVVKWEQANRKEIREHYNSFFNPKTAGGVK